MAEDKIATLRHSGAKVSVVSPEVTPAIRDAALSGDVEWRDRHYQPGDLEGAFLSIAATDQRKVNQQIFQEAERLGVLLNVVDDPAQCTFIAPSIVQRGSVTLAISTGGASPALARKLREALTNNSALEWADLVGVLSQARQEIKKRGVKIDGQRWQCCLKQELLALVQSGSEEAALDAAGGYALTVGVVTKPFLFEGRVRMNNAERGLDDDAPRHGRSAGPRSVRRAGRTRPGHAGGQRRCALAPRSQPRLRCAAGVGFCHGDAAGG